MAASRIAAQFGAGRFGQVGAAFVVVTAPMVVLQATSTQTDLTVAAWAGCAATLLIDHARGGRV
jgi:4-amino-4-deoxy-L-arabinose transferase-like glycosyltransferase